MANDSQHHLCGKHHLQLILELCLAWRWIQWKPEHFYIQCTGLIMPTNIWWVLLCPPTFIIIITRLLVSWSSGQQSRWIWSRIISSKCRKRQKMTRMNCWYDAKNDQIELLIWRNSSAWRMKMRKTLLIVCTQPLWMIMTQIDLKQLRLMIYQVAREGRRHNGCGGGKRRKKKKCHKKEVKPRFPLPWSNVRWNIVCWLTD